MTVSTIVASSKMLQICDSHNHNAIFSNLSSCRCGMTEMLSHLLLLKCCRNQSQEETCRKHRSPACVAQGPHFTPKNTTAGELRVASLAATIFFCISEHPETWIQASSASAAYISKHLIPNFKSCEQTRISCFMNKKVRLFQA